MGFQKFGKRKRKERILPKTNRDYKTDWFLADLTDVDRQIFNIIHDFMNRTRAFRNKQLWAKYAIFLYLSGGRRTEPFLSNPTISRGSDDKLNFIKIIRVNEKHFEGKKQKRQKLTQIFVGWNKYEQAMFNYLLDNKSLITLDFTPLLPPRSKKITQPEDGEQYRDLKQLRDIMHDISIRFSGMFKAKITNGTKVVENGGLVPHMLRHIRAYNLWIEKGLPDSLVQRLLGWDRRDMLDYYAYISKTMKEKEEISIYKRLKA